MFNAKFNSDRMTSVRPAQGNVGDVWGTKYSKEAACQDLHRISNDYFYLLSKSHNSVVLHTKAVLVK